VIGGCATIRRIFVVAARPLQGKEKKRAKKKAIKTIVITKRMVMIRFNKLSNYKGCDYKAI
jgi:hypothetical protein